MIRRKRAPYSDTEVPPERTKSEIERLLRDYGAEAVQWTEHYEHMRLEMRFVIRSDAEGARPVMVKLVPPAFLAKRKTWNAMKGYYETVDSPNWAQSLRLLKSYLKAKLESIAYGLRDVEEEFLSDVVVRDRAGNETTVLEAVHVALSSGELKPALPPGTKDADYSVQEGS